MKIWDLLVNHRESPLGIGTERLCFSFLSDTDDAFCAELYDGERRVANRTVRLCEAHCFSFVVSLQPGTLYEYRVTGSDGTSASARFETGIVFDAPFITPEQTDLTSPMLTRRFTVETLPAKSRLYMTGLGLYRAELNGERVGDLYLTPGYNDYDAYLRYQTYDVTGLLREGENCLTVSLGDGWYKGRFGIDKPAERGGEVFGSRYLLAAVLLGETDGIRTELVRTDDRWTAQASPCLENSIYDGEVRDFTAARLGKGCRCVVTDTAYRPVPEDDAPIRERAVLHPTLYISPKGEQILDFGQNMVGFVRFGMTLKKGTRVTLSHGEVLQKDCFYNANLRTARAQAVYVSDGQYRVYEPMFTYFGFRYVLVEGLETVDPADFCGVVLSSDLRTVLSCETDHPKINRLISNTVWGQRGNFLDVPTDCPQRDERLGWTADTQVFSRTACYQMDCYPFYRKYLKDLRADQTLHYGGDFPMYSPSLRGEAGNGGAVWADCGTILPWNLYEFYGDRELLEESYPMMRDYAELLLRRDAEQGGRHLILYGFTFGDWLAQDGVCAQSLAGGTDTGYIMSVYYYHSIRLTAYAAEALGLSRDAERYRGEAAMIREAILDEFFAPGGKLALDTQTAYVLSLHFGIYRDRERVIRDFRTRLSKDFYRLKTGFTGTPLLLPCLFDNGMDEDAFRMLYQEDCPGWLYAVNLGATTVWERWNSILPDGTISGINMNSLNHYAYGSVCEAIYSRIAGLRPAAPGWTRARIAPHPNWRMKRIRLEYRSPSGLYRVFWECRDKEFWFSAEIPAGCEAEILLPGQESVTVGAGMYEKTIPVPERLIHPFDLDTPNLDILANAEAKQLMRTLLPQAYAMVTGENDEFRIENGRFLGMLPMFGTTPDAMKRYEQGLRGITV